MPKNALDAALPPITCCVVAATEEGADASFPLLPATGAKGLGGDTCYLRAACSAPVL